MCLLNWIWQSLFRILWVFLIVDLLRLRCNNSLTERAREHILLKSCYCLIESSTFLTTSLGHRAMWGPKSACVCFNKTWFALSYLCWSFWSFSKVKVTSLFELMAGQWVFYTHWTREYASISNFCPVKALNALWCITFNLNIYLLF